MAISVVSTGAINKLTLTQTGVKRAAYRAINKAVAKGKTLVSRRIRDELNLKAGYVGSKITTIEATSTRLHGDITASKRGILMSRFAANRLSRRAKYPARSRGTRALADAESSFPAISAGSKPAGVSVKIKRAGSRQQLRHAFPIRLSSGAIGVAVRTGRGRKAFKILYSPSPSQVFDTFRPELAAQIESDFKDKLQAQIAYELRGLK